MEHVMAPSTDIREDIHRLEDTVGDLRDRVARHEGQDEARHVAQMEGQAAIREELGRVGDAVRSIAARLPPGAGLVEPTTTDADRSDERAIVARVRLPKLPAPPSVGAAARWGVALMLFGGPLLAAVGGMLGLAPASVQAAVHAVEQMTTDAPAAAAGP
jgi:hypothetical protein